MRSPARRQSVNVILTQSMPVHPLKSEQKLGEHAATGGLRGHRALATVGPISHRATMGHPQRRARSRSGIGTKRNCLAARGISGAGNIPAVPSTWRRQPLSSRPEDSHLRALPGRVEDWRAGLARCRATSPVPSTSNAACGFPALRSPICFMPRFMGPIQLGRLSACRVALDSC